MSSMKTLNVKISCLSWPLFLLGLYGNFAAAVPPVLKVVEENVERNLTFECTAVVAANSSVTNQTVTWEYRSAKNWTVIAEKKSSGFIHIPQTSPFQGRAEVKSEGRQITLRNLKTKDKGRFRCRVSGGSKKIKKTVYKLIECPRTTQGNVLAKDPDNTSSSPTIPPISLREHQNYSAIGIFYPGNEANLDCLALASISPGDVPQKIIWRRQQEKWDVLAAITMQHPVKKYIKQMKNRTNISAKNGALEILCLKPGEVLNLMCEIVKAAGTQPKRLFFKIIVATGSCSRNGVLLPLVN